MTVSARATPAINRQQRYAGSTSGSLSRTWRSRSKINRRRSRWRMFALTDNKKTAQTIAQTLEENGAVATWIQSLEVKK